MALTDVAIKNAKPREKPYKMGDAGGLFLLVQPSGGKLWRLKYRVDGREKKLGIGTYPEVGLADARKRRDDARELIAAGKDPSREKQRNKVRARTQAENTFTAIAEEYCNKRKRDGDKAWAAATATRSEYLLSLLGRSIGRMAINEIEPPDVLAAIRKIEGKGNRIALNEDEPGFSEGTGFLVDRERGWIITNAHVATRSPSTITLHFRSDDPISATRIHVDPVLDLAVLQIDPDQIPAQATVAELECSVLPSQGTRVIAYGNPGDMNHIASRGIVTGMRNCRQPAMRMLQSVTYFHDGRSQATVGQDGWSPILSEFEDTRNVIHRAVCRAVVR